MIYLMQILRQLKDEDVMLFMGLFADLKTDLMEMEYEYKEDIMEYVNELLINHFGFEIDCELQLAIFTDCVMNEGSLKAAVTLRIDHAGLFNYESEDVA